MNENGKPKYSIRQNLFYILGILARRFPQVLLLVLAVTLCNTVLPLLAMFLPKVVVDLLTRQAGARMIVTVIGGLTLALAAVYFVRGYCERQNLYGVNNIRQFLIWDVLNKSLRCDYSLLESAEGQALYQRSMDSLDGDQSGVARIVSDLMKVVASVLVFLLTGAILSGFNPWIVVFLVIMALIQYAATRYAMRYEQKCWGETSRAGRKRWYINSRAQDPVSGKDIRLYGMQSWFEPAWWQQSKIIYGVMSKARTRYLVPDLTSALMNLLRDGLCYLYIILEVSAGRISLGEAVLFLGAVTSLSVFIGNIVTGISSIFRDSLEINKMRGFLDVPDAAEPENPLPLPQAAGALSIEFRDVTFRYTPQGEPVIDHLSFLIRPGEHVALVGVNGAGKTTLVKLLCGFYQPDSGQILIGGVDSSRLRRQDLYSLFSAVFQEAFILPFTVAENVALKEEADINRARVNASLDLAGLGSLTHTPPKGIDSLMTRLHGNDGLVLSGGEQQKLLLARALYKDARVLVLDEPTAALDPIAESELYEKYQGLTAGKTALYISHRLASTRFCDTVFFLSQGKITETGIHEELMALHGQYAHMYEVQSHYYQRELGEEAI